MASVTAVRDTSSTCFPCCLIGHNKKVCKELLQKVKSAYWKGVFSNEARSLIEKGRKFCEKFSINCKSQPVVELDRYVNALALRHFPAVQPVYHFKNAEPKEVFGVSKNLNAKFPDLADFMSQQIIRSPRALFGHKTVEEKDGTPLIHYEGHKVSWDTAKKQIFGNEAPNSMALPYGWKYVQQGVVHKDQIKWTKLEPLWKDDIPPQKGTYYLQVISKQRGFFGELRHCFVRLIDDQANVISVGLTGTVYKWLPFREQKGKLSSPDPWEYQEGIEYSVRFPINQNQYEKIKNRIESDQNNKDLYFNIITRNCSTYATEILEMIGIKVDVQEHPPEMVLRNISDFFGITLPIWVKKVFLAIFTVFNYLISPFLSILIFLLGGAYTNKDLKVLQQEKGEAWKERWRRPFSSLKSLFDTTNFLFHTGWKMTEWQKTQESYKVKNYPKNPWNALK